MSISVIVHEAKPLGKHDRRSSIEPSTVWSIWTHEEPKSWQDLLYSASSAPDGIQRSSKRRAVGFMFWLPWSFTTSSSPILQLDDMHISRGGATSQASIYYRRKTYQQRKRSKDGEFSTIAPFYLHVSLEFGQLLLYFDFLARSSRFRTLDTNVTAY